MRTTALTILACTALLSSFDAAASLAVADYQRVRAKGSGDEYLLMRTYIDGLTEGFDWMNAALIDSGKKPLFCAPMNIALNAENYMQILDEALKREPARPRKPESPVELLLLRELERRLPCKP